MEPVDVRELVERARGLDADAWEALYRHTYPRLFAYARRSTTTAAEADDAVSETMVRALRAIDRFSWRGAGFDAWLFGILRNVLRESYRRNRREVVGGIPDRSDDSSTTLPEPAMMASHERRALLEAFQQLSDSDREVLELRVLAELDATAAGEVLGKNAGAVRTAQSRALGRLRGFMEEVWND